MGSLATSASRISVSRSRSACKTTSISFSGPFGRFLCKTANPPARWNCDAAGFRRQITTNGVKQRGFADAVAADEAHACARYDLYRAVVDQKPSGNPDRDIGDGKHAGFSPQPFQNATCILDPARSEKQAIACRANAISRHRSRRAFAIHRRDAGDRMKSLNPGRSDLLEAFAHSVADRSAGPVIERFERRLRVDFS